MNSDQTERHRKQLRKILMFQYLSEAEMDEVLRISSIVQYTEGDKIISEGEVSPYMYAVLDGSVNVLVREKDGREIFISAIGEGDIFGEAGIFLKVKRTANVVSTRDATIFRVHRSDLLEFIRRYPSAGIKVLMVIIYSLLRKLRESNQELAFERKSVVGQEDIDAIVQDIMHGR